MSEQDTTSDEPRSEIQRRAHLTTPQWDRVVEALARVLDEMERREPLRDPGRRYDK